jgi:O-antigen/teichoic acid export membrane protein
MTDEAAREAVAAETVAETLDSREAGGKIIRGGSLRAVTYVVGVVVGAASVPFVVRHLGVRDYGRFVTVMSLAFIVFAITEGGLGNLGVREYATRDREARVELMRGLLGLRMVLSAAGVAVAVTFALAAGYDHVMVIGVVIAGSSFALLALQHTLSVPLQTSLRLGLLSALDAIRQATTTVLMVLLVVLGASLLPFYAVSLAAAAAVLATTVLKVRGEVPLLPSARLAQWKALLRETAFYAAATALGTVYFQIAVVATWLLSTQSETGYYSAAFRVVEIANGIPWLLATTAFPLLARAAQNDADRLRYALQRLFETSLLTGGAFALVTLASAPFAIHVVGGKEFEPASGVLRILAAGMPATFLLATWAFALLSLRLYRQLIIASGSAVVLAIVLSGALIPPLGADGAGITTAVLEVVLAALYGTLLMRARPDLRVTATVVPRFAIAAAAGTAAALFLPVHPLLAAAAAAVVFLGLMLAMGAVPAEIFQALRGGLRAKASG